MEKTQYTSLKQLVDSEFTVEKVYGYQWKKYDPESKRMIISEKWEKDYNKVYGIVSDKGTLDVSAGKLGEMLEKASKHGEANILGKTFSVKSNGKEGMDIRYYLNLVSTPSAPTTQVKDTVIEDISDEAFDLSEIGF
jgi:hypothetical protein